MWKKIIGILKVICFIAMTPALLLIAIVMNIGRVKTALPGGVTITKDGTFKKCLTVGSLTILLVLTFFFAVGSLWGVLTSGWVFLISTFIIASFVAFLIQKDQKKIAKWLIIFWVVVVLPVQAIKGMIGGELGPYSPSTFYTPTPKPVVVKEVRHHPSPEFEHPIVKSIEAFGEESKNPHHNAVDLVFGRNVVNVYKNRVVRFYVPRGCRNIGWEYPGGVFFQPPKDHRSRVELRGGEGDVPITLGWSRLLEIGSLDQDKEITITVK